LIQINSSYKRIFEEKNFTLNLACPDSLLINSYPSALLTILQHLINNSLDHAFLPNHKGEITLSASLSATGLELLYTDNGPGLDPEVEDKIFEPFFTTSRSEGHSGLGLSIANNLILNLLDGFMDYKNAPGKGLVFKISIPVTTTLE
jgi:signal transduction histidine kinase